MSNFFTKLTSVMGAATLVAVSTSASLVAAASEFLPYAETLADNGVITAQSSEAGYRLGDNVTRAEIAKVVANLGGIDPVACSGTTYSDVGSGLGDLCGYVEALADAGVVSTSSATFRPNANVTRAEMVKMILGALGEVGSDVDAGYMDLTGLGDLASYVNRANEIGCISDASYFRPNASSSRGEAFKVAVICAGLDVVVDEPTDGGTGTGTSSSGTTSTGGSVTVALDGTAMAQYVPKNASSVKVGSVKLTAGAADVTVSSLVVSRSGLGNAADISSVQLTQNGVALSDARSMSTSSQSATLKFTNNLVLKAGTSASVDVLVSLSGAENNQHQFAVTSVTALNGATVAGAPVTLGLLNTTSYTVGTVNVDSFGGTPASVTSGKSNQLFNTVKLTPSGKDAVINSFTLTKGTGSEDYTKVFANVSAYFNGAKVGTVTLSTDKLTVTGLNIARLSGEQASVELRADIIYVGAPAKTSFKVDSSFDVSATEKTTGYAMMVSGYSSTTQKDLDLNAVDLTITKTSTGTATVAPGASAVELYKATITSDATFDVSNYTLQIVASHSSASGLSSFSDNKVTVYINGVDYELSNSTAGATTSTKNWTATADRFRVEPGVPVTVRVVGNLKSNAYTPVDYTTTFSISELRNVSNGATSSVTKSQAGDKVTVKSGTVILKDATVAPPSTRRIYSSADLEIGRFAVEAQAENLTLRKLTVTNAVLPGSGGVSDWTTIVSGNNVKLVDVATNSQVSATVTVTTTGSIVFDNMSAEVTKDTTRNLKVVATTTSFSSAEHNKAVDLRVTLDTVDKSSGGSASGAPTTLASVNTTNYVTGVVPPTVTLTKKSAKVFLVKVTNVDSDSTVQLEAIKARVKPVADNNSSYKAIYCLRAEGSSVSTCPEASTSTSTGAVPGAATNLTLASYPTLSKNGGTYSYEILVDSDFVDPTNLLGEVLQITYNTGTTEDYTASAQ
ncbi:MAG: hypothetical protein HHAS10_11410 [Candidatus Altimarinota bacterium]